MALGNGHRVQAKEWGFALDSVKGEKSREWGEIRASAGQEQVWPGRIRKEGIRELPGYL